jgi:hypothetical protein
MRMWDKQKRQRFQELRQPGRYLEAGEQAELATLIQELEAEEAAYLKPATERLRQENDRQEKRHRILQDLIQRRELLVQRLKNTLTEAQAEERAIENELASALAGSPKLEEED